MRTENCEYLGTFWLPDRPDRKVHGTLTIEDGGRVSLKTIGLLADQLDLMNGKVTEHKRIVGCLAGGEPVTLERSGYVRGRTSFSGSPTAELRVHIALIGVELENQEWCCFDSVSFTTDCLDEWHGKTGISVDHDFGSRSGVIRYKPMDDVHLWREDGRTLKLTFAWSLSALGTATQASISQRSFLRYSTGAAVPIDDLVRVVHRVQHFLSFATGKTVSLSDVNFRLSESVADPDRSASERTVRVYYRSYPFREKQPRVDSFEMPVPYAALEGSMQAVMDRWFSLYDRAGKALRLYWGALNDSAKFLDGRFLFIIQALEVFHRLTSTETVLPKDTHRALFKSLIKACPAPYRELIAPRLRYAHELSLSTRLQRLVDPFATFFDDPVFLQKVVRTRNYFTHWDPKSKEKAARDDELSPMCAKLEALFCLLLMREIGLTSDTIGQLVEKNRELKWCLGYRCDERQPHAS